MTLLLALLLAQPAAAQLFSDANAAFLNGDVARAVASYEALVAQGVLSPELETNFGAACLRQGKRGQAALHFERALFLNPGDEDARADLLEVRRGNVDRLEGDTEEASGEALWRLLAPLPGTLTSVLLIAFWCAGWALLAMRVFGARLRYAGLASGICFALAAVAALFTWGAAEAQRVALQRAVVVAPSTPAREGPAEKTASHFEVHEGTTVRVEDEDQGYLRVKLANGLTGWVPASTVELVVPPGWAGRPVMAGSPRAAEP